MCYYYQVKVVVDFENCGSCLQPNQGGTVEGKKTARFRAKLFDQFSNI